MEMIETVIIQGEVIALTEIKEASGDYPQSQLALMKFSQYGITLVQLEGHACGTLQEGDIAKIQGAKYENKFEKGGVSRRTGKAWSANFTVSQINKLESIHVGGVQVFTADTRQPDLNGPVDQNTTTSEKKKKGMFSSITG